MSLHFCTNCGHQLKDGEKACPNCGAVILNDDLTIDEQLDLLKNDDVTEEIKVKDDRTTEVEDIKVTDDRVEDKTEVKVTDDRVEDKTEVKVTDDRTTTEEIPVKVTDDREVETEEVDKEEKTENGDDKDNNNTEDNSKKEVNQNKEGWLTKTLKITLGILSFLILFACTFGAFVLKPQANFDAPNYFRFILNYLRTLDGASLSVSLLGDLVFNLVIPVVMIIVYFIKQFICSIKIFKVGKNTNRDVLWTVMIDNLIGIFIIKLVSSIICKPCMSFNPLDLLMLPSCINLIFYIFLYFFKLFRNEIGTFRFGKANSGKLIAHRIIQTIVVCSMFVLCMISVQLNSDGIGYNFKPLFGIRSFLNDRLDSYILSQGVVPNTSMMSLFVAIFEFGINLTLMMFEVTILIFLLNTIYRFVLRDVEEEYFNDCFFKNFSTKMLTCLGIIITFMLCKFVCVYIYLTSSATSLALINFSTCISYLLPYIIGIGIVVVFSIINSVISKKWLKQVKE